MQQGELWWATLPAPARSRPVLLLSRNEAYPVRNLVTVAPLTSRIRHIPSEVPLGTEDGLPKRCAVNLDTITTVPEEALAGRIIALTPPKLAAVDRSIRFSLGPSS